MLPLLNSELLVFLQMICIGIALIYFPYVIDIGKSEVLFQSLGILISIAGMLLLFFRRISNKIESMHNQVQQLNDIGIISINLLSSNLSLKITKSLLRFTEAKMAIGTPAQLKLTRLILDQLKDNSNAIKLQLLMFTNLDNIQSTTNDFIEYDYEYDYKSIIRIVEMLSMKKMFDISVRKSSKTFVNGFIVTPASVSIMLALYPENQNDLVIVSESGSDLERSYRRLFDDLWANGVDISNKLQR